MDMDNSLAKIVVGLLKEQRKTITAAESLTAGEFQSMLGTISGVSKVFPGGFVTYSTQTKFDFLSIEQTLVEKYGTVSKQCAEKMAIQSRKLAKTDYGIAFTGVAGPDLLEHHPVGTVWISLSSSDRKVISKRFLFTKDRASIRYNAVMQGFELIRRELLRKK